MPRKAASITQADIARVIRAMLACGLEIRRVLVQPDGAVAIEAVNITSDTERTDLAETRIIRI